jgi:BirA family transcriptional regulator, biotin operon repressor / biotin---[acetyl-CoA-carboxylase] ligase
VRDSDDAPGVRGSDDAPGVGGSDGAPDVRDSEDPRRRLPGPAAHATPIALGRPRLHLRRVGSTNDRARELALAGAPHGTLVTADAQTAGRGRQGRRWSSPPGSSLLMSLVLRPGEHTSDAVAKPSPAPVADSGFATLPLAAAVAVCDVAGPEAHIKWPNDILLPRPPGLAKLAGILVEGRPQHGWAALGIGVNVAVDLEDLPAELRSGAATLSRDRAEIEPLLVELLAALERRLGDPRAQTLDAWRARDALYGHEIAWSDGHGRATGIDDDGRLLVELPGGSRTTLAAGEVHLQTIT